MPGDPSESSWRVLSRGAWARIADQGVGSTRLLLHRQPLLNRSLHSLAEAIDLSKRGVHAWCYAQPLELVVLDRCGEDPVCGPEPLPKFGGVEPVDLNSGDPAGETRA